MAFFPCIYFCENNQMYFTGKHRNLRSLSIKEKADVILHRSKNRQRLYEVCLKLFTLCDVRGLRLILENPYAGQHYLVGNFPYAAAIIDRNRSARGDYYNKPTQYWFINCQPTSGESYQMPTAHKTITSGRAGIAAGICSEDRSMISPDYARNFICDFVIGKKQEFSMRTLFENL